jgi:F-type H+-transporting ATPase subunit delta
VRFSGNRWAGVFVNALGENAEETFACLKAIVPLLKTIPCAMSGYAVAGRVEKMLTGSVKTDTVESAMRFVLLLIQKDRFRHIDLIMEKIEEQIFQKNGILAITAESAAPMESGFEEYLRQRIEEITGDKKVIIKSSHVPELLGGYRLRMDGFYIDASLKGQVERMKASMEAAAYSHQTSGA